MLPERFTLLRFEPFASHIALATTDLSAEEKRLAQPCPYCLIACSDVCGESVDANADTDALLDWAPEPPNTGALVERLVDLRRRAATAPAQRANLATEIARLESGAGNIWDGGDGPPAAKRARAVVDMTPMQRRMALHRARTHLASLDADTLSASIADTEQALEKARADESSWVRNLRALVRSGVVGAYALPWDVKRGAPFCGGFRPTPSPAPTTDDNGDNVAAMHLCHTQCLYGHMLSSLGAAEQASAPMSARLSCASCRAVPGLFEIGRLYEIAVRGSRFCARLSSTVWASRPEEQLLNFDVTGALTPANYVVSFAPPIAFTTYGHTSYSDDTIVHISGIFQQQQQQHDVEGADEQQQIGHGDLVHGFGDNEVGDMIEIGSIYVPRAIVVDTDERTGYGTDALLCLVWHPHMSETTAEVARSMAQVLAAVPAGDERRRLRRVLRRELDALGLEILPRATMRRHVVSSAAPIDSSEPLVVDDVVQDDYASNAATQVFAPFICSGGRASKIDFTRVPVHESRFMWTLRGWHADGALAYEVPLLREGTDSSSFRCGLEFEFGGGGSRPPTTGGGSGAATAPPDHVCLALESIYVESGQTVELHADIVQNGGKRIASALMWRSRVSAVYESARRNVGRIKFEDEGAHLSLCTHGERGPTRRWLELHVSAYLLNDALSRQAIVDSLLLSEAPLVRADVQWRSSLRPHIRTLALVAADVDESLANPNIVHRCARFQVASSLSLDDFPLHLCVRAANRRFDCVFQMSGVRDAVFSIGGNDLFALHAEVWSEESAGIHAPSSKSILATLVARRLVPLERGIELVALNIEMEAKLLLAPLSLPLRTWTAAATRTATTTTATTTTMAQHADQARSTPSAAAAATRPPITHTTVHVMRADADQNPCDHNNGSGITAKALCIFDEMSDTRRILPVDHSFMETQPAPRFFFFSFEGNNDSSNIVAAHWTSSKKTCFFSLPSEAMFTASAWTLSFPLFNRSRSIGSAAVDELRRLCRYKIVSENGREWSVEYGADDSDELTRAFGDDSSSSLARVAADFASVLDGEKQSFALLATFRGKRQRIVCAGEDFYGCVNFQRDQNGAVLFDIARAFVPDRIAIDWLTSMNM